MRKLLTMLAALAAMGLMGTSSANAAARWSCEGAEYVCGGTSRSAAKPTYEDASDATTAHKVRHANRSEQRSASVSFDDDQPVRRSARRARVAATSNDDEGSAPRHRARRSYGDEGGSSFSGMASYYWEPQALASGGRFNPNGYTAAHKTLPFGTRVLVTNQRNGSSVEVVINDRGPYVAGRVIDLSKAAAQAINMTGAGVAPVSIRVLGRG